MAPVCVLTCADGVVKALSCAVELIVVVVDFRVRNDTHDTQESDAQEDAQGVCLVVNELG